MIFPFLSQPGVFTKFVISLLKFNCSSLRNQTVVILNNHAS